MIKTFNQKNIPIMLLIVGTLLNIACFYIGWFSHNGWMAGIFYVGAIFGQYLIGFFSHMPNKNVVSKRYVRLLNLCYIVLGCVMTDAVLTAYHAGYESSDVIISQQADFALLTWLLLGFSLSICRLSLIVSCSQDKHPDNAENIKNIVY